MMGVIRRFADWSSRVSRLNVDGTLVAPVAQIFAGLLIRDASMLVLEDVSSAILAAHALVCLMLEGAMEACTVMKKDWEDGKEASLSWSRGQIYCAEFLPIHTLCANDHASYLPGGCCVHISNAPLSYSFGLRAPALTLPALLHISHSAMSSFPLASPRFLFTRPRASISFAPLNLRICMYGALRKFRWPLLPHFDAAASWFCLRIRVTPIQSISFCRELTFLRALSLH